MSFRQDYIITARLSVLLGLSLIGPAALAKETPAPAPAHGPAVETKAASTGAPANKSPDALASVPSPKEIDPALRETADALATTNIIEQQPTEPGSSLQADLDAMLDWGRRMRREKNYDAAEASFANVMKANAPEAMHRTALLELAMIAQEKQQPGRAQQIYSQYLERFGEDPSAAEVYLRQGLLYRQMGAPNLALSKFYAVMTTALRLKLDRLDYYQRLVLQAQTEVADTYYLQGKFGEAAEYLGRLLKLDNPQLNKSQVIYKMIRSLAAMNRHTDVVAQAEFYLTKYSQTPEIAEVRFLLADSLKKLGHTREATQQVLTLLESQQSATNQLGNWIYWQQRTGNEIANQLYKEGDYLNALEIYQGLAELSKAAPWQMPVWYQMGLVYERLMQPAKAAEFYTRILDREKELDSKTRTPSLNAVLDMARWRKEQLQWQLKTAAVNAALHGGSPTTRVALGAK